ncbi:unnamed protein product [Trichogramma brassicae]|uniref:Eukaryotic translation initiation factor 3 subunit C n=1 Tax=Trichogramma brassicae TaxID=86971 RepID=A0A6H5IFL1_9HYME|nr:unnamed protein product [Trichogramma brassicae]
MSRFFATGSDSESDTSSEEEQIQRAPAAAFTKGAEDDSDSDSDWGSSSDDESSSSSDDDKHHAADYFRKTQKDGGDDEQKQVKKDHRKDRKEKDRKKKREEDDGEGEWETVKGGVAIPSEKPKMFAKDAEINAPAVIKKLNEIIAARGKKRTDRRGQIELLHELQAIAENHNLTSALVKTKFAIVSSIFDYNPKVSDAMKTEYWSKNLERISEMMTLLLSTNDIILSKSIPEDEEEYENSPFKIHGCVLTLVERLDEEFIKLLKECDPHSNEYVERLKDENQVCTIIDQVEEYLERQGVPSELCRIYIRKIEHLYYKCDPTVFKQKEGEIPADASTSVTVMDKMCKYIYSHDETDRLRTRAILSHIYHHAIHDNWFKARDLFLMSHLQDNIHHSDPATQILYNRAVANLGLCAFRHANIKDAHNCLLDLMMTGRVKELLAQGFMPQRQHERNKEQEKIEKMRQMPFHMHINLEVLECVYLVSAMLIEIPYMAAHEFDARKRMISKTYYQQLRSSERQSLVGPPESMREHVVAASKAMRNGNWAACNNFIINEKMNGKVWDLFNQADKVRAMLTKLIKEEALRTYLFTYSHVYDSLSMPTLALMFELERSTVHSIISKMIINEELMASLDEPSETVVMHRSEPSRLQSMALQLTDKVNNFVDSNERIFEMKQGNFRNQGNFRERFNRQDGGGRQRRDRHYELLSDVKVDLNTHIFAYEKSIFIIYIILTSFKNFPIADTRLLRRLLVHGSELGRDDASGPCPGHTEASSVATTLQAPAPATKLQDSIASSSSNVDAGNNKGGVQRKRGIPNDGWVGLPSAYGLGQPWDQSPWRPIKGPSLQFDTSSWQYGSGGLGSSLGSLGGLAGWPSKDIPRQVPLVVTKHVLVEKPVTVEKVVHVPVERIVHKAVPVGIPVPHAVPVHISHAVPLPIRHAVPVPYHQPYPVPVRQPIPYAVPVPIPYPVHHNGYPAHLHRNYQSPLGGLYAPYLAQHHAGASVAAAAAAIKHGLPGYHHHHHQHLGLHHQHQHHAPIHAANLHGWGGHRLVPPPVYLGHDFSGGQQHHLHYGHHQQQLLPAALHHHQQHHHLGHQLVAAASEQQQQHYRDDEVDDADEDEDKKSKRSSNAKSRTESSDVRNLDDNDEKN